MGRHLQPRLWLRTPRAGGSAHFGDVLPQQIALGAGLIFSAALPASFHAMFS